ncbi:MAG: transglutaminase-like domain-containing protein [Thermoprotei archaeon]
MARGNSTYTTTKSLLYIVFIALGSFLVGFALGTLIEFSPPRETSERIGASIEEVMQSYISEVDPIVRRKAVEIIVSHSKLHREIYWDTVKVYPGSWYVVTFAAYPGLVYEIKVTVLDTCVTEQCDIEVLLKTATWATARDFGRIKSMSFNFTLESSSWRKYYRLFLDNSYSSEIKNVVVSITVFFSREIIDDEVFKVYSISKWVTGHIVYVSDPWSVEYIASPREVLETGAGDCEDYAVLLAALYRSIGLKSAIGLVDIDGDQKVEHAAAPVYIDEDLSRVELVTEAIYYVLDYSYKGLPFHYIEDSKTGEGLWLVIDPVMAVNPPRDWRIEHEPYTIVAVITP